MNNQFNNNYLETRIKELEKENQQLKVELSKYKKEERIQHIERTPCTCSGSFGPDIKFPSLTMCNRCKELMRLRGI